MIDIHHINAWEYIESLPDKCFDLVLTDPMYDSSIDMDQLRRVCRGHIIAFCSPLKPFFKPDDLQYWVKTPSTKNYSRGCGHFVEWITFEFHGDVFNNDLHWSNYTGVHDDKLLRKPIPPYEKPNSLLERLIYIYSNPGDIVFDPFFGSGSTLVAADNMKRNAVGCEIDEKWVSLFRQTSMIGGAIWERNY